MDLVLKRVMAYVIDVLIVTLLMSFIVSQSFINPYIDEYMDSYNEYTELVQKAQDGEIDTDTEEYKEKTIALNYEVSKYKVVSSSITVVGMILYFVVLQWALKGQTLGKKLMKIRVVANNEDKELNIGNYFLRSLILNNIVFSIILIVGVYIFKENGFYTLSMVVSYLQMLVTTIIMLMVVLRKDFRGLHDVVAGTKVIDLNPMVVEEANSNVSEDKKIIETKEVEVQEKKNVKKKETNKSIANKKSSKKSKTSKEKE